MITDFDRSRLQTPNRFGKLSKNMFFARHVPQPRFLKFITGTAGVQVCHVRDDVTHLPAQPTSDLAKSLLSDPRFTIEFPPNSYNEALLRSYSEKIQPTKRRERFLPPIRGWNASGTVVADTENWRRELTRIAEMVGLLTVEELDEIGQKKEPIHSSPPSRSSSLPSRRSSLRSSNGEYSTRTGRWNETPKSISRSRTLRGRTPLSAIVPDHLFCVDEKERESWMLQVLCQILKTNNINDVQAWLAASNPSEKEAVRQLITSALKGLEESGRIEPTAYFQENATSTQINMNTLGALVSNKFPTVPSNQPTSSPPKSRTHSSANSQHKLNRSFQPNLQSIDEESRSKLDVPQPTTADSKRDIQVLTLNDDTNQSNLKQLPTTQDEIPF